MSGNLRIALTMLFNGSTVTDGIDRIRRKINEMGGGLDSARRRFTQFEAGGRQAFNNLGRQARELHASMNGFGVVSQVAGAYAAMAGANSMKSVIEDNLEFERTLLKIRFNAQATTKELAEMRKVSLDMAKGTLNSPLEMLEMHRRFANAGLKNEDIRALAPAVAGSASVFEAPAMEIADMLFDLKSKFNISIARMPQMLDMLYYHGTSGRFETRDLARQAPLLLNAGAQVGLTGEGGLNFMGALTQRLMRNATVQNPSEVAVMAQHGLEDITSPHYVSGFKKVGIDLPSFFDQKGHFKGEDGVEGIIALSRAMKKKGLDNPFKLGEAGFREQHTRTFWLEIMRALEADDADGNPNLLAAIKRGKDAADARQIAKNLEISKQSDSGKVKAAEIDRQTAALSKPAAGFTSAAASLTSWASENMGTAAIAGIGVLMAGKLGWEGMKKNAAGKRAGLGDLAGAAGGLGLQKVFVTNWPSSMQSPKEMLERKRDRMPDRSGGGAPPEPAVPRISKVGQFLGGMKGTFKYAAPVAVGMGLMEAGMIAADGDMDAAAKKKEYKRVAGGTVGSVAGSVLGGAIGAMFGGFGAVPGAMIGGAVGNWGGEHLMAMFDKMSAQNKKTMDEIAQKPIPVDVKVTVENGNIVAEVDRQQQRQAMRK